MSSTATRIAPVRARLHFELAPEPARLLRSRERIRDYLSANCANEATVDDLVLAVQEACTNAIRHSGSDQPIEICLAFSGDDLRATVKDRGRGFDVGRFDPATRPDPLRDDGRGLYLMARLCDELRLRCDGGLEVDLLKRAAAKATPPPPDVEPAPMPDERRTPGQARRMRALLDEIDEGFATLDWEFRYTHVNAAACRLLERKEADILGRTPCGLWLGYANREVEGAYRAAMELGRPSITEHETADHHWFEERIYPTTMGVSVYFRNIDARKRVEAQAAHLTAHAPAGIFEVDFRGPRFRSVNDFMCEFSGYSRGELLAMSPFELLADDDRPRFVERMRKALAGEPVPTSVECRGRRRNGDEWWAALSTTLTYEDGRPVGAFVVAHDVTERKKTEDVLRESAETMRQLLEAADTLRRSLALDEVLDRLARLVLRESGHSRVTLSLWDEERRCIETRVSLGDSPVPAGTCASLGELSAPTRRAIRERRPVLIDYDALPVGHRGLGDRIASRLAFGLPLCVGERFLGLLAVDDASERQGFSGRQTTFLETIAAHAATAMEQARLYEAELAARRAEERRAQRLAIIHQITEIAVTTSGTRAIAQRILDEVVSRFDLGLATIFQANDVSGRLEHLADWAPAPEPSDGVPPFVPEPDDDSVRVYRSGEPVVVADIDAAAVAQSSRDALAGLERATGTPLRARLILPLASHEKIIGSLDLAWPAPRRFETHDVDFFSSIAHEIAVVLENARSNERQQRIATILQESLIHSPPSVPGLEIGTASATAFDAERVGGDFGDAFLLKDGRVALTVGDVAGKGIHAAGMTESVRATIRAFAAVDPSPVFVLAQTNELMMRLDADDPHVTAFFCVLDPCSGHLSYASAGHPAPIHCSPVGSRVLPATFGPPLGSFATTYMSDFAVLTLDDYLVLYTDGVTEARRGRELYGEQRLVESLDALCGLPAQEVATGVLQAVGTYADRLVDDIQIVAVRVA